MRRLLIFSLVSLLLVAALRPHLSGAILAHATGRSGLSLSVLPKGDLSADGWFHSPVEIVATSNHPEAVITHAVNGGEFVQGSRLQLETPGEYSIIWNACKGDVCYDGFEQKVKIVRDDLRPLSYDPDRREWSFSGQVVTVRDATLLGQPGQVARIKAKDFEVWVALKVHRLALADQEVKAGDLVRVWISGPHVSFNQVDWSLCSLRMFESEVSTHDYCAMGEVLDDGLASPDSNYKLSPSNQLIRAMKTTRQWQNGLLYWNTSLMERNEE